MSQPGLWSNSMHFQVLILTNAGDSIHEVVFHLGSVPLDSTMVDALE